MRELRQSIQPTYDHRETGDRFTVTTTVGGRQISATKMPDPFLSHRIIVGWRDLLRGLLRRRLEVVVVVDADRELVEDVLELNADYAGDRHSTRRQEFQQQIEAWLGGDRA